MTKDTRYNITDPDGQIFQYIRIKDSNYKYTLARPYRIKLNFATEFAVKGDKYSLSADGVLMIYLGYSWDGASGPAIDTKNNMRASCIHDVLYQMMRESDIKTTWKDAADKELQRIMIEDGVKSNPFWNKLRAGYYYWGVRLFGGFFCQPNEI